MGRGCKHIRRVDYGYSDANKILHVVHNHERSLVTPLDYSFHICSRIGIPHTEQMVSHTPRDI